MKQSKSVLQFTNLYLAFTEATETEDKETLNMIKALISEYQPDLCIFTGNQIYANDKEKGLAHYQLFLEFMNLFDIKIATTFGNRDAVDGDMKSELRQMEAEISQNYVKKAYRKVVNHKEAYVIEVKKQGKLLHQLYMIDNGTDGVIEQAHNTWLQDVQNKTLDQYGYVPKHNLLFTHHPIIEQVKSKENMYHNSSEHSIVNLNQLFSLVKDLGNIDGVFCGHSYDDDFSTSYQGIDLNYGRTSGFSLYSNLAPGARLIELQPIQKYFTEIIDVEHDKEDATLNEEKLIEEIRKL